MSLVIICQRIFYIHYLICIFIHNTRQRFFLFFSIFIFLFRHLITHIINVIRETKKNCICRLDNFKQIYFILFFNFFTCLPVSILVVFYLYSTKRNEVKTALLFLLTSSYCLRKRMFLRINKDELELDYRLIALLILFFPLLCIFFYH